MIVITVEIKTRWLRWIGAGLIHIFLGGIVSAVSAAAVGGAGTVEKPNVVFIFADDLGYGEIEVLDPEYAKIPTPQVNRLAAEGQIFTDVHTSSSVCSPSRYSLLTGRYNWRTRLQRSVLNDGADPLIAQERKTLGHLFREQGYHTAIFGKWHLGFNFKKPEGGNKQKRPKQPEDYLLAEVPVGSKIVEGPITRGFDTFFGFQHARSMSSVMRDDQIIEEIHPVAMLPRLDQEVANYIDAKAADAKIGKPFFIYFPQSSPHAPIVPSEQWQGKTTFGDYADFVSQTDASVGVVLDALERNGLRDNTLVIFSSDNGSSKNSHQVIKSAPGHRPSGPLRGAKGSLWDGGHRVPFVLSWPARAEAGTRVDQLICLSDMMATFAELFSVDLPEDTAEDSISFLPAIDGKPIPRPRRAIVHHDIAGHFSIRDGDWKLLLKEQGAAELQLYNLQNDLGEKNNLVGKHPEKVKDLLALIESYVKQGRSTPGAPQKNDVPIELRKESYKTKNRL